jgi:uncharacterized protein YjaG (DUF416 family)
MSKNVLSETRLDRALNDLGVRLGCLSRRQQAAFFLACGEGLFPLYERFQERTGWGNAESLRAASAAALAFVVGGVPVVNIDRWLRALEEAIPDGEKFDAPESTYAQDVVICFDAAVRASVLSEPVNVAWVEYPLEPAKIAACLEETGFTDLGSSDRERAWRDLAVDHPRVRNALSACGAMIDFIMSNPSFGRPEWDGLRLIANGLLAPDRSPISSIPK